MCIYSRHLIVAFIVFIGRFYLNKGKHYLNKAFLCGIIM